MSTVADKLARKSNHQSTHLRAQPRMEDVSMLSGSVTE